MKAPVVIGRDHLDAGSVASPYRETESMRDGSDAIADWPILNALVNVAAGATWVSVHHGGGVGIGNAIHAGMVVVADGTDDAAERLERVLTTDPGMGVLRHADAGYPEAIETAHRTGLRLPACGVPTHSTLTGCVHRPLTAHGESGGHESCDSIVPGSRHDRRDHDARRRGALGRDRHPRARARRRSIAPAAASAPTRRSRVSPRAKGAGCRRAGSCARRSRVGICRRRRPPAAPSTRRWARPCARSGGTPTSASSSPAARPARIELVPAAGWRRIEIDASGRVRVPAGVIVDLGATAKALAADRAAAAAFRATGSSVLVNLGGDIAVAGPAPAGGWPILVTDDHRAPSVADGQVVAIAAGGLATSSTTVRRWRTNEGIAHHVVDPRTGRPAAEVWRTVSVAAASCVEANTASTAAIVCGEDAPHRLDAPGIAARLVRPDGRVVLTGAGRRRGAPVRSLNDPAVWYLMRGSGVVALILFTGVVVLGIATTRRFRAGRIPRFVTPRSASQRVAARGRLPRHPHRDCDRRLVREGRASRKCSSRCRVRSTGSSSGSARSRSICSLAVMVTSLLRHRLSQRIWKGVHWLAYASWPIALFHSVGIGTDKASGWFVDIGRRLHRSRRALRCSGGSSSYAVPIRSTSELRCERSGCRSTGASTSRRALLAPIDTPLPRRARDQLRAEVEASGLTGRGGAAFPTARKLAAVAAARNPIVVANGTEGEPASWKDKVLLAENPHLVVDGAVVAARIVGAREVVFAVGRANRTVRKRLEHALAERSDGVDVSVETVPDRFVAGEESALLNHLNGGAGEADVAEAVRARRARPERRDARERRADRALRRRVVPRARNGGGAGHGARHRARRRASSRRRRGRARHAACATSSSGSVASPRFRTPFSSAATSAPGSVRTTCSTCRCRTPR